VSSILIVAVLWAAVAGGFLTLRMRGGRLRVPVATIAIAVVVSVVSVIGELNADVLSTLGRDLGRLQAGEWWRAITPLVVQDGGWPGLVFNVIALLAVGAVAESLFRRWFVPVVFVLVGLLGELAAYTLFTGQGFAGNSVANLGLAGVLLVTSMFFPDWRTRLAGVLGIVAGLVLLVLGDLHSVGFLAGAAIGLTVSLRPGLSERVKSRASTSAAG
jgi:membrane associated rhomboid family serine protease